MPADNDLVAAAKKGDKEAFGQLYVAIYTDLYKFAYYTLKNEEDAQDAVSDAVMDAYAGISGLKSEEAFKAWMFRILSAKCKRKLKEYAVHGHHAPLEDAYELAVEGREGSLELKSALDSLSDEEKMIVSMNVFGGYDSGEISSIMKLNRNTVRSKQSRALSKLKTFLTGGKAGGK